MGPGSHLLAKIKITLKISYTQRNPDCCWEVGVQKGEGQSVVGLGERREPLEQLVRMKLLALMREK